MSAPPVERGPWIYFIQVGNDGPIKIGFTAGNPRARLSKLQIGNPEKLKLLAAVPGSFEDEQAIHATFVALRIRGEWFRPDPILHGFILGASWHAPPMGLLPAAEADERLDCGLTRIDLDDIVEFVDARRLCIEMSRHTDGGLDSLEANAQKLSQREYSALILLASEARDLARHGSAGVEVFGREDLAQTAEDLLRRVTALGPES